MEDIGQILENCIEDFPVINGDPVEVMRMALDEIYKLREETQFLDALRAAGVDNWDGYQHAQEIMEEWNDEFTS